MISSLVFSSDTYDYNNKQNNKRSQSRKEKQKELTRRRIIIIIQIKHLDSRARNTHQQKIRILYI